MQPILIFFTTLFLLFTTIYGSVYAQPTPYPTCRYSCSTSSCGICTVAGPNSCTARNLYCCPPQTICDPRAATPTPYTCGPIGVSYCSPVCNTSCWVSNQPSNCLMPAVCCIAGCTGPSPTAGPTPTPSDCISPNSTGTCLNTAYPVRCPSAWLCCNSGSACPVWSGSSPTPFPTSAVTPTPVPPPYCNPSDPQSGISTAFGCLPIQSRNLVSTILGWSAGLAGGIAFFVAAYAVFLLITSSGDQKKIQAGRELLTAAIAGLVIIALAVVLLNFLGLTLLNLPTFVGNPNI